MARTLNKGADLSRLRRFAQNHLGVIMTDDMNKSKQWRSDFLHQLDLYYDSEQYDDLQDWDEACEYQDYVSIRKRKPRVIYNLPKAVVNKVAAKLVGEASFPKFIIEDDDDDTAFFRIVQKACKFRRSMIDPIKHMLVSGAVFVRYYLVNGNTVIEYAKSKYCYPVFDGAGQLESIDIKYVYDDQADLDKNGKPIKKWYLLTLTKTQDIAYDNPEFRPGVRPDFKVVATADHGLGWVQGEWLVTHSDKFDFDGYGIFSEILDFCDELNYSLSQTSQAVQYNQEPQLTVNGMDEDEIDSLIKSSQKAWSLGREGEAKYLETDLKSVEQAQKVREEMRNRALEVVRIVLQDPEKEAKAAQSGKALEILNAPLVELVDELRTYIEPLLTQLLIKIAMTCLHFIALGEETAVQVPAGYMPTSLDITVQWPPMFPVTIDDIVKIATACQTFSTANVVSRESLTRWVASATSIIDNADEELKKIEAQPPPPNPFGSFDGGMQ